MAVMDVDNGLYSNYLIRFDGIGLKRYMAFGNSKQNGKWKFLIARFKDDTVHLGVTNTETSAASLIVFPNPSHKTVTVESDQYIQDVHVQDVLGREMIVPEGFLLTHRLDVSGYPDGSYYIAASMNGRRIIRPFVVRH